MEKQGGRQQEVTVPKEHYDSMVTEISQLKETVAYLTQKLFAPKTERFTDEQTGQLSLFDRPPQPQAEEQSPTETISYTRKKKKQKGHAREAIPEHIPRRTETLKPDGIPQGAKLMGVEVTEVLEYEPGQMYVRRIEREKYVLPKQEGILIAPLPSLPLPQSNAGAGLLAFLLVSKYVDHLPFDRQIKIFKRQGVELANSTLSDWFMKVAALLEPLYDRLKKQVLASDYIMGDETTVKVLGTGKKGKAHRGYFWVYYPPPDKLPLFDFHPGRDMDAPNRVLENFQGHLQTDGYSAYEHFEKVEGISLLACMAHARRKFFDARDNDRQRAEYMLGKFRELYELGRIARENQVGYQARHAMRQRMAVPILEEIEKWLNENCPRVLPRSRIGTAIQYTLKLWGRLKAYVQDGKFEIDNNLVENSIRPVALGRKNYLFAGSRQAAQNAAMFYTFFAACKVNQVEPLRWLTYVLNNILDTKASELDKLLPNNFRP